MAGIKSCEGKVIGGKRVCGKSTELIRQSHRTGTRILTANKQMARILKNESKKMGLNIKPPLTPDVEFDYFGDVTEVLVDEVEMVLQQLIGKRVTAMSTSYQLEELPSLRDELKTKKKISDVAMVVDVDISDALKGLKAVQREARKATAALKKLEEQKKDKYLVIELDELGDVPRVFHNGKEIHNKIKVGINWDTADEKYPSRTNICIDYYEKDEHGNPVRTGIHKLIGSRASVTCPKCGSTNIQSTEKVDGCNDCGWWKS